MPQVDYAALAAQARQKTTGRPLQPGNVDLYAQPKVKNPDGTTSTVDSSSYNIDGREVLLPSVTPDGRHLKTADDILAEYRKTGRHLGMFDTPAAATAYASQLHDDYASGKYDKKVDYAALAEQARGSDRRQPVAESDWIDKVTEWLPAIGGTVGGVAGAAGGPVGSLGGAALGGMAGEAYREVVNRARGRTAPASIGEAAGAMAKAGVVQGAAEGVGLGLGAVVKPIGARIMQSAVKPGLKFLTKADPGATPQVVKTLLDEGINVTPGGVGKLQRLIAATNDEIKAVIRPVAAHESPALASTRHLSGLSKRYTNQVNPSADLDAISQVGQNFLEHPAISARGTLTIGEKQAMKQGTYARIGEKYGTERAAGLEAEKALARGLKDDIAAEAPAVSALNAKEGKLLEALDAVGRRVAMAGNRDPIGFAWVAHNPTTFLAALMDRSPAVKSLLARGLYNHAGQIAKVPPALIRTAVVAIASDGQPGASASMSSGPGNPR